jgi:protein O-GlcNAc transferase
MANHRKQRSAAGMKAQRAINKNGERPQTPAVTSPQSLPGPTSEAIRLLAALFNQGRYTEAEALARQLTERFPIHGFGWKVLGAALKSQGRTLESLEPMQKAAMLLPGHADAHSNLGVTLKDLGKPADAEASYRRALEIKPDYIEAYNNLGNILKDRGRVEEAEASYRRALKIKPDYAEAHSNMGIILKDRGRLEESEASCRRALEIKPDYADAHNNLGVTLRAFGRLDGAETSYRRALEIEPDYVEAHNNLGNILKDLNRLDEAEAAYRRALTIKPDYADAHYNLGVTLRVLGRLDEAEASYRRALEIKPDYAEAHNNLGNTLKDLGRLEDAEASYRRALKIRPDHVEAHSNLLFTLSYSAGHDPSYHLEEARRYGQMVAGKVRHCFSAWRCLPRPERLRVGFVSGDLHNHPVGYFLENLLAHIDRTRVELIAFPTHAGTDDLTIRIKPYFADWKPLSGLNDEAAARLIHSEGVHILLDLSGHTAHNRLPVFAWKPAPVQVSWLGYSGTTGVPQMDYVLTDKVRVPEAHRGYFTETVWYLPDTRLCFTAPDVDLPVQPLPALANGYITFACFQNLAKLSDSVLETWGLILAAVPTARMRLQCKQLADDFVRRQTSDRLKQFGIDPARLAMYGSVSRAAYLASYAEVDINLDTFPFPGATTTCEAIWMGVPTLTMVGDSIVARNGAGVLVAAGLTDWVAAGKEDYVAKAIVMAGDLPKLAALRAGLRKQALASPLFDSVRFARNFASALWGMWQQHSAQATGKASL